MLNSLNIQHNAQLNSLNTHTHQHKPRATKPTLNKYSTRRLDVLKKKVREIDRNYILLELKIATTTMLNTTICSRLQANTTNEHTSNLPTPQ